MKNGISQLGEGPLVRAHSYRGMPFGLLTLAGAILLAATVGVQSQSYSITVFPGDNFIANHLNHGGNTLNELMPVVPDGCQFFKFDKATQTYSPPDTYFAGAGWLDSAGVPSTTTFQPGEGASLRNPGDNFTLTFTGSMQVPALPIKIPPDVLCLVSRQIQGVGTYENIVGCPPEEGARIDRWNPTTMAFSSFTFNGGVWSPSTPLISIGESVFLSGESCVTPQPPPTDKVAKWSQPPGLLVFPSDPQEHGVDRPSSFDWNLLGAAGVSAQVQADDFLSDGRPITCVRWWGSYLNSNNPGFEDAFVLSFFNDIPLTPNNQFSQPGQLLASYVAPLSSVTMVPTDIAGLDGQLIYEYRVDLKDTCLDHATSPLATATAFLERSNTIFWISISAEVGRQFAQVQLPSGGVIWTNQPTSKTSRLPIWGWHTGPVNFNDVATQGALTMQGTDWIFGNWGPNQDSNGEFDQAFELLTPVPSEKEIDVFPYSLARLTVQMPNGDTETLTLAGPAQVEVQVGPNGEASDQDNNGLDDVPAELTRLDLTGFSLSNGPVRLRLRSAVQHPFLPSLGAIEETANTQDGRLDVPPFAPDGTANSFFDVYFELEVGGQVFHNVTPKRLISVIHHKPPAEGDTYQSPTGGVVELLNENNEKTGILIGPARHTPNIEKEVDHFTYSAAQLTLQIPSIGEQTVTLAGPTTVLVNVPRDGSAADTDGNGRDQVPTEMTELNLAGSSPLGPVSVVLDPEKRSLGAIEERNNNTPGTLDLPPFTPTGSADSFFDIWPIIQVGTQRLRPAQALHLSSVITHKPPAPGESYTNPFLDPIELVDENGQGTGIFVVKEVHTPNIPKEIDVFDYSLAKITLEYPGGANERITLAGPSTVKVCVTPQGGAADTDGDGLDQVPTEMTQLELHGNSSQGPVTVRLNAARPSLGEIEEQANNTPGILDVAPFASSGLADSFFDVFVEVEVGGQVLTAADAVQMRSVLDHKPPGPGTIYISEATPIDLLNSDGVATGIRIIHGSHMPNIPKEIDQFNYSVAQLTVRTPDGDAVVTLAGPTTVRVCIPPEGDAADTDGDGLDQVPTEMVALNLTGSSPLGPIQITLDPNQRSMGEIQEQANNTPGTLDLPPFTPEGSADSFFDIFPIISVGGQNYHPAAPLHLSSVITHKPPAPGESYTNPFLEPIELLDENGQGTGYFVIKEVHTPNPSNCLVITCPSDIVTWTCSENGVPVDYSVTATSLCGTDVTLSCDPPSGSVFPVGNTTVTCTASDNEGHTTNCTFIVTVILDTEAPVLTCPSNIVVQTCDDQVPVFYTVSATDDCDTNVMIVCNPPSGSLFPVGTHQVICVATDQCGHASTCEFQVEVQREPAPHLTISRLNDQQIMICWVANCPGWRFQCTRSLDSPILWETVTNVVTSDNGMNCVILNLEGQRFYRLIRRQPMEVYEGTDLFPPQGTYLNPGDEVTVIPYPSPTGEPPRRLLARWFVHPIPPPETLIPRPPPCLTCMTDTFDIQTEVQFQVSMDEGKTWMDIHAPASEMVQVKQVPSEYGGPDSRTFETEMVRLDVQGGNPASQGTGGSEPFFMLRESPTKASLGRTTLRRVEDGTFMVDSFFDIWIEVSLDGGQTWGAAQAAVPMMLNSLPAVQFAATDAFPPAGTYNSPRPQVSRFDNGILTRWYAHPIPPIPDPNPPGPTPCLTCGPVNYQFETELLFQVSTDGGKNWMDVSAPSSVGVRVKETRELMDGTKTRFFDTEMIQLDAQIPLPQGGGSIATPGILLRESKSQVSKGLTTVQSRPDGTFLISSFFDIFTEISLDGGQTWHRSLNPTHVEFRSNPPEQPESSDNFPPQGSYDSPADQITEFGNGLWARGFLHPIPPPDIFPPVPPPCLTCPPENYEFRSTVQFQVSTDQGKNWMDVNGVASDQVEVIMCWAEGSVRVFSNELLKLDVQGGGVGQSSVVGVPAFMIRESPTRASKGFTSVRPLAAGGFMVGSFFDIFTEISLDGGKSWSPSVNPTHMELHGLQSP
jgi:HYR domain